MTLKYFISLSLPISNTILNTYDRLKSLVLICQLLAMQNEHFIMNF